MENIFEIEDLETFTNVSEDLLNNLYNSKQIACHDIGNHIIQAAKESLKKIVSDSNFDINRIAEVLKSSGLNENKVDCFLSLVEKKRVEILCAALLNHNSIYGETITDFDWFLKLVVGTNDLKTQSYPLLQLVFSTVNCEQDEKHRIYDINKDVLVKLISLLENINNIQ